MTSNSWIIVDEATGRGVYETWNPKILEKLNTSKYFAMTALDYLIALNRRIQKEIQP